jgi:dihydrofolate reductase
MKTILYMGVTPNGLIARPDGNSEWTSWEDLQGFHDGSKAAGNCVMGSATFREVVKYNLFPYPDALNVVVTKENVENAWGDKALFTNAAPREILALLEKRGFETAFLIGGGFLNSAFAKERLIDEIYFDVEPLLFGRGIPVFREEDFEFELELVDFKKLNADTVQLHYRVKK